MFLGKKTLLFLSASVLIIISCSKTATVIPNPGTTSVTGVFSCKINGTAYSAAYVSASYQYIQLMLVGSSGDYLTKLDFTAIVSGKVGTYDLKNNANYTANKKISMATSGTLNLTKFDTAGRLVSGTFSYTTQDSTKITEGIFTDVGY